MKYADEVAAYILKNWKYDPATGIVIGTSGQQIGVCDRGYRNGSVGIRGETIVVGLHRAAWLLMTGKWPERELDHIDGGRGNNRWLNLREATHQENMQNRYRRRKNGLPPGVYPTGYGKFMAQRRHRGALHYGGTFDTVEEATSASNALKARLHTFQPEDREECLY